MVTTQIKVFVVNMRHDAPRDHLMGLPGPEPGPGGGAWLRSSRFLTRSFVNLQIYLIKLLSLDYNNIGAFL